MLKHTSFAPSRNLAGRRFLATLAAIAFAFSWPSIASASLLPKTVSLKPNVVIESDVVRLGDLFSGLEDNPAVAAIPVANAPALGKDLQLTASWLATIALQHNVAWQPRTTLDQTIVQRASQLVGSDEIMPIVRQALADYGFAGDIQILFDDQSAHMLLPSEVPVNLSFKNLNLDPASGRFSGQVAALGHGGTNSDGLPQIRISGKAIRLLEIPVLNRRVMPGEVIAVQDVDWIKLRADQMNRDGITQADHMVGLTPRRALSAGQMVRANQLQTPVMIKKNSLITMQLVNGQMLLTVQGRALDNGAQGDIIRVMNTNSRKVVNAVVTDSNMVEVRLPGANLAAAN